MERLLKKYNTPSISEAYVMEMEGLLDPPDGQGTAWAFVLYEKGIFWNEGDPKGESDLMKIMRRWREKPPPKYVLEDFKKCLRLRRHMISRYGLQTKGEVNIFEMVVNSLASDPFYVPFEFVELLQKFACFSVFSPVHQARLGQHAINSYQKGMKFLENHQSFLKLIYGQKIARYIEEQMDDSKEMKPLRTKIDIRKGLESYFDGSTSSTEDIPPD